MGHKTDVANASAARMGYAVGDLVFSGAFPGIIVGEVRTTTPLLEVWGMEHEAGSCYARDLRKMDPVAWKEAVQMLGHTFPLKPFTKQGKAAYDRNYAVDATVPDSE